MLLLETAPDGRRNWDFRPRLPRWRWRRRVAQAEPDRPARRHLHFPQREQRRREHAGRRQSRSRRAGRGPRRSSSAPPAPSSSGRSASRAAWGRSTSCAVRRTPTRSRSRRASPTATSTSAPPPPAAGSRRHRGDVELHWPPARRSRGGVRADAAPLPELRAAGELTSGEGDWALKALKLRLGQSDVEGGVAFSTRGPVPYAAPISVEPHRPRRSR